MDVPALRAASPAEVAAAILSARFLEDANLGPGGRRTAMGPDREAFSLAEFQRHAVDRARHILRRRGGVIIADSVGLGKTFIGLALMEEAVRAGDPVLLTVPAALRRTWAPGVRALAGSGTAIHLLSHTALARGLHQQAALLDVRMAVVDEAHAFRNRRTRRYRALAEVCAHARVVLLTATPVNNGVPDLYALLRLFSHDAAFRDLGLQDLRSAFRDAERTARAAPDLKPILPVLRDVVVRRTRPFIREHYGAVQMPGQDGALLRFPQRAPPRVVRYRVADECVFDAMAGELMALGFSALAAGTAPCSGRRGGLEERSGVAELARLALLKRMESALPAFLSSLRRLLRFHDAFLDALGAGRLLRPGRHRTAASDDTDQLFILPFAGEPLPGHVDAARLAARAGEDLLRLRRLEALTLAALRRGDPKLAALFQVLDEIAGNKVVVFTEFRDTAAYLWRALLPRGHLARVDGAGAWLGTGRAGRRAVIERFAPVANRADPPAAHERVDTLIATDVLAEGLNLQDAAHVVSYDLPWNPVRLIQRVGRVDRLGSPHQVVHPHIFLPDKEFDTLLGLVRRIRRKLATIGATVGVEGTVLDGDAERPSIAEALARGDAEVLDALEREEAAPFEVEERLRMAWSRRGPQARGATTLAYQGAPVLGVLMDSAAGQRRWLVAAHRSTGVAWVLVERDGRCHDDPVEAGRVLELALESVGPEPVRARAANVAPDTVDRRAAGLGLVALDRPSAPGPAAGPPAQARAARRLLRALAAERDMLAPGTVRRADVVLHRLAGPLHAATERRLAEALRETHAVKSRAVGTAMMLDRFEEALGPAATGHEGGGRAAAAAGRAPGSGTTRLIGVLRVVPAGGGAGAGKGLSTRRCDP